MKTASLQDILLQPLKIQEIQSCSISSACFPSIPTPATSSPNCCPPLIAASRKDPGCIGYDCKRDELNADTYLFIETWKDDASLDAHMQTAHFKTFVEQVDAILEAPLELHKIMLD